MITFSQLRFNSLAHPQFFLIHSGLGEMDISYPLTNPLFKAS
jgi:hypothetical protein